MLGTIFVTLVVRPVVLPHFLTSLHLYHAHLASKLPRYLFDSLPPIQSSFSLQTARRVLAAVGMWPRVTRSRGPGVS